jgi:prephenate dehydrogenase
MKTVAIVGVGLIGGSFGLALRKAGFIGELIGVSSAKALEAGLKVGAISRTAKLEDAVRAADVVYLAQPVDRILAIMDDIGPCVRSGSLVTDAGSTKVLIVEKAKICLPGANFLGGHPLAGKEQRGAEAADADLFRNRPYVLTPMSGDTRLTREFELWLQRIGAKVVKMPAAQHDAAVAFTSHLPQLLSTALAMTLAAQSGQPVSEIFGPGLLDMTRLALSTPELWMSILSTNKTEVNAALDAFMRSLDTLRKAVGTEDLRGLFHSGAEFASKIRNVDSSG